MPADDKMIGWNWADLGVSAGETVQKVEINVSTDNDKIGKWQGAFGSSTTVEPDYWTQTKDMSQTIDGKSGTITWNVDSATASIIQPSYGGQLKFGIWWIDCDDFTIDSVVVYTDKTGTGEVTTTTTTTAKTDSSVAETTTSAKDKATTTTTLVP